VLPGHGGVAVPDADVLLAFADAALSFDADRISPARAAVRARLGEAAMIDAAAVIAGFNGITRIADATGIPLEDTKAAKTEMWRHELGIDAFQKAKI
jgi:hypothetical protein